MKEFRLDKALWGIINMALGGLFFWVYFVIGLQFYTSPTIPFNSEFIVLPLLTAMAVMGFGFIIGGANRIHEAQTDEAEIGGLTVKEYIEIMKEKGFHFTKEEEKN